MFAHSMTTSEVGSSRDDRGYDAMLAKIQERFIANLAVGPLFMTDADGLFDAYLDALPSDRQYHTCSACRRFITTYGGLATIDEAGRARSALWHFDDASPYYAPAVAALARIVHEARITGVFLSKSPVWGQPVTGPWTHFAVTPPAGSVHRGLLLGPGRAMAEKLEDYRNVQRALAEFTRPMIEQALTLLETDSLYRSEKVIGPAKWLLELHIARDVVRPHLRDNVTWRAVAKAPAGFCHPRASMVGTLLEDIASGIGFDAVSRRFAAKMHPLQYQRQQVAPSAGNIAAAEKVIAQLDAAGSLARRFARLDEIESIWRPIEKPPDPTTGGVFGHVQPKGAIQPGRIVPPPMTMTWDKFRRTVLPTAEAIEYYVSPRHDNYSALLTAVNPGAPPILQWDREDRRNPVSWYVWHGGSPPSQWGLEAGRFCKVTAVTLNPAQWGPDAEAFPHQGHAVLFILDGARDSRMAGNAIFPETLRSEFHGIRSTIEAYSRGARIEGVEDASACGIALSKGGSWDARFRVTAGAAQLEYRIDRWD